MRRSPLRNPARLHSPDLPPARRTDLVCPKWALGLLLLTTAALSPSTVRAQQTFDPSLDLELFQGPIVAPANIVGMGGAHVAIAEGSGAQVINGAAVANRFRYNRNEFFDWDWSFDVLTTKQTPNLDFENNGRETSGADATAAWNVSIDLQIGRLGLGLAVTANSVGIGRTRPGLCLFTLCVDENAVRYEAVLSALSLGYNFFDGRLVVALQAFAATARVLDGLEPVLTLRTFSTMLGAGVLWRPQGWPFRVGATFRTGASLEPDTTLRTEQTLRNLILPKSVVVPWQASVGVAYKLGKEHNPPITFGDEGQSGDEVVLDEEIRPYVTLAVDLLIYGTSARAVGLESWVEQDVQRAGEDVSLSIRTGIDSEFWPNRMRGRVGFYIEPSRFEATRARTHITAGFDVRLFELVWDWRAGGAVDASFHYFNWMISVGFWH